MERELELRVLLGILRKRSLWLFIVVVITALTTFLVTSKTPVVYQCTAYIEVGRVDDSLLVDPHALVEIINSYGAGPRLMTPQPSTIASEGTQRVEQDNKIESRPITEMKLNAECLETGRKQDRIVYLVRLTMNSKSKTQAKDTIEIVTRNIIQDASKSFNSAIKLYQDREAELLNRINELQKIGSNTNELSICQKDLFEARAKLLPSRTYPTRLATDIAVPEIVSSPTPIRNAMMAGGIIFFVGLLVLFFYEFLRSHNEESQVAY